MEKPDFKPKIDELERVEKDVIKDFYSEGDEVEIEFDNQSFGTAKIEGVLGVTEEGEKIYKMSGTKTGIPEHNIIRKIVSVRGKLEETPKGEVDKTRIEAQQKKRYGIEDPNLKTSLGKGAVNVLGSIFGARFAWEAPRLVIDYYKKKEQREKLSWATLDVLEKAQMGKMLPQKSLETKEGKRNAVLDKIELLNEKLREAKLDAKEKMGLRDQIAKILWEYRKTDKDLEEARTGKIGKVLDLYINNSAQAMTVAKEAVNTVSVLTFTPWLRSIGYTALSGAERWMKAANNYDKTHFGEKEQDKLGKLSVLAKDLTVNNAKEFYNGLVGNFFKKEVGKIQTTIQFSSALGTLSRVAGIVEFEHALQAEGVPMHEAAQKIWESLGKGQFTDALKQGGENWVHNAQRLLHYIGLSDRPEETIKNLATGEVKTEVVAQQATPIQEQAVPANAGVAGGIEKVAATVAVSEKTEELGKINELAQIHSGEGVIHAFTRQIEHNPAAFGFKGNIDDHLALHKWAQQEAYEAAVKNNFVNEQTGEEVRVSFDAKNPSSYILNSDKSVEVINRHEYILNNRGEIKASLHDYDEAHKQPVVSSTETVVSKSGIHEEATKVRPESVKEEYISTVKEGGNIPKAARSFVTKGILTEDQFKKVWNSPDSLVEIHGAKVPIKDVWLSHAGDQVKIIEDSKGGHFEVVDNPADKFHLGTKEELGKVVITEHPVVERIAVEHPKVEKIAPEQIREITKIPVGKGEMLAEHIKHAQVYTSHGLTKEVVNFGGSSKAIFDFKNGEIIGHHISSGEVNYHQTKNVLRDDWFEVLKKNPMSTRDLALSQQTVQAEAVQLSLMQKALAKMNEWKHGTSAEADYLKHKINDTVSVIEKKYGEIFKNKFLNETHHEGIPLTHGLRPVDLRLHNTEELARLHDVRASGIKTTLDESILSIKGNKPHDEFLKYVSEKNITKATHEIPKITLSTDLHSRGAEDLLKFRKETISAIPEEKLSEPESLLSVKGGKLHEELLKSAGDKSAVIGHPEIKVSPVIEAVAPLPETKEMEEINRLTKSTELFKIDAHNKIYFKLDANHQIIGIDKDLSLDVSNSEKIKEVIDNKEAMANLKFDWLTNLKGRIDSNYQDVLKKVNEVYILKKGLLKLIGEGRGNSAEADALKSRIGYVVSETEKKFGDIFESKDHIISSEVGKIHGAIGGVKHIEEIDKLNGAKQEVIEIGHNLKAVFKFNKEGEITQYFGQGKLSMLDPNVVAERNNILKEDWEGILLNRSSRNTWLDKETIENRATNLLQDKIVLNKLERMGKGDGPEAKFLKKIIIDTITMTEKIYGDVFKNDFIENK
jgi:hypothetical protein